jgi:peptidoglycan-associated lipoprotein
MGLNGILKTMTHAFSRKALFVVLSAVLLLSVGCRKKPRRDPSQTVISQTGQLNPNELGGFGADFNDGTTEFGSGLTGRDGVIETDDMIRGLLQPVYFGFDQSAIAGPERTKLDAAKAYLDANPQYRLLIEGRADWRGTTDYNLGLGDRRANAAKQYLVTIGVPDTKVEVLSKGDLEATENASEEVMAQDRRADLVVLKK